MGWKASLVIIENRNNFSDEKAILKAIGKQDFEFSNDTTLEESINPNDKSISIGYFNGNIVIADDYQLTTKALESAKSLALTSEEKGLVSLFPDSEIVMVACHSVVNYHGYCLIQYGKKKRLKAIVSGDPVKEFGERTAEEELIYKDAIKKDGTYFWKDDDDPEYVYAEDQLMEKFTFEFAKRRLGVLIDDDEGEELLFQTTFKKYIRSAKPVKTETPVTKKKNYKWLPYLLIILALVIWQILKRTVLKN
jgi:hypothetical protein